MDTLSANPLNVDAFPKPMGFVGIDNQQGRQNQQTLGIAQTGAINETAAATLSSSQLESATASLRQKKATLQAKQQEKAQVESERNAMRGQASAVQAGLNNAQNQVASLQSQVANAQASASAASNFAQALGQSYSDAPKPVPTPSLPPAGPSTFQAGWIGPAPTPAPAQPTPIVPMPITKPISSSVENAVRGIFGGGGSPAPAVNYVQAGSDYENYPLPAPTVTPGAAKAKAAELAAVKAASNTNNRSRR